LADKPWSAFPQSLSVMATAAEKTPKAVVPHITRGLGDEVGKQGSKFHIRGRKGDKVRLGVKTSVKGVVGRVSGNPPGFWRIVTDGSKPHIIAGGRRGGGRRAQSTVVRRFVNADTTFGDTRPLKLGSIGFRQYAHHPGHSGFGDPWRKALDKTDNIVSEAHDKYTRKLLVDAWKK
jgi:hypothetical protein